MSLGERALVSKTGHLVNMCSRDCLAARLRLRPIVMTSMAFVLGVLPLAIATGASSGSQHSIGTSVVGGTLAGTFLAMFFVPLFFYVIARLMQLVRQRRPAPVAPTTGTAEEKTT